MKKSEQRAVQLWKQSAEQGNADAQFCLGECYEQGEGVKADASLARHYYNLAAAQGDRESQQALNRLKKAQQSQPRKKRR